MFESIAILLSLPWLDSHPVRSARYHPKFRVFMLLFVVSVFFLGKVGGMPADVPLFHITEHFIFTTTHVAQIATLYYFGFFLVILPLLSRTEKALPMPVSIHDAVTKCKSSCGCGV